MTPQQTHDLEQACRLLWEAFCDDDPTIRTAAARLGVGPKGDRATIRARRITPQEIQWLNGTPPAKAQPEPPVPWAATAIPHLQRRPGRWAAVRIANSKSQAAHAVVALKRLGADATQRREERGFVVYASWPAEVA